MIEKDDRIQLICKCMINVINVEGYKPHPTSIKPTIENNSIYIEYFVSYEDFQRIMDCISSPVPKKQDSEALKCPNFNFKTHTGQNILNKDFGRGKTAKMSVRYKNIIQEFRKDGKTIRQISNIIGISPTTVQKVINESKNESGKKD